VSLDAKLNNNEIVGPVNDTRTGVALRKDGSASRSTFWILCEQSASCSENACLSNLQLFRSVGYTWPRSMTSEPVVNGCLPLTSPGRHNSTPSPVWYAVC